MSIISRSWSSDLPRPAVVFVNRVRCRQVAFCRLLLLLPPPPPMLVLAQQLRNQLTSNSPSLLTQLRVMSLPINRSLIERFSESLDCLFCLVSSRQIVFCRCSTFVAVEHNTPRLEYLQVVFAVLEDSFFATLDHHLVEVLAGQLIDYQLIGLDPGEKRINCNGHWLSTNWPWMYVCSFSTSARSLTSRVVLVA